MEPLPTYRDFGKLLQDVRVKRNKKICIHFIFIHKIDLTKIVKTMAVMNLTFLKLGLVKLGEVKLAILISVKKKGTVVYFISSKVKSCEKKKKNWWVFRKCSIFIYPISEAHF